MKLTLPRIRMATVSLLIISAMASGENAETWLQKGAEAYAELRLQEAGKDFQKAVEADPYSAKAHLSLGVIYFFQYQNGIALQPDQIDDGRRTLTTAELQAIAEKRRIQIAEQNSTNAGMAEAQFKKALELEPHYEQAMEYLGALYFWWRDPATEHWARRDDARQVYTRIAELNPRHRFADYVCGAIDYEKAFVLIRSTPGFPRPVADEESRRYLRAKVGPLLNDSSANFLRSLEIDPNDSGSMTYLGFISSDQAYIAELADESARLTARAAEWHRKVDRIMEAQAKATGQPWPPGDTATITFDRIPGKPPIPPFPPDARLALPPAPPPPPPAFRR